MSRRKDIETILDSVSHTPLIRVKKRKEIESFSAQRLARMRKELKASRPKSPRGGDPHFNHAEARFLAERAPGIELDGDGR